MSNTTSSNSNDDNGGGGGSGSLEGNVVDKQTSITATTDEDEENNETVTAAPTNSVTRKTVHDEQTRTEGTTVYAHQDSSNEKGGSLAAMGVSVGKPVDPPPPSTTPSSKMQALEIDDSSDAFHDGNTADDGSDIDVDLPDSPGGLVPNNKSFDEFDDDLERDMQGLLTTSDNDNNKKIKTKRVTRTPKTQDPCACCSCCISGPPADFERHGNYVIFLPRVFARTGWGIMGPHWFGPPCVVGIILGASSYFIRHAWTRIGPISAAIGVLFTIMNLYLLINTVYRDPGIVMPITDDDDSAEAPPSAQHRWCDFCKAYQPPSGAHCPDCNCCIAGYDHHCVWMGTCIGKKNYKQFIRFNLSWLVHLVYAVLWVSVIGPITYRNKDDDSPVEEADDES